MDMKRCLKCGLEKAEADFYRQTGLGDRLQSRCKVCHNAACHARRRANPAYRAKQYAAKKRWNARNPERVLLHVRRCEGRLIWDPRETGVPLICRELESLLHGLNEAIHQHTTRRAA